jgi:hypothetical protein
MRGSLQRYRWVLLTLTRERLAAVLERWITSGTEPA